MKSGSVAPHLFVVLGGTGDLMRRKLLPALFRLCQRHHIPPGSLILGVSRKPLKDDEYRMWAREALLDAGATHEDLESWCAECVYYACLGNGRPSDYHRLKARILQLEQEHHLPGNRVFYLALPPQAFPDAIQGLGTAGLAHGPGWTRLVIEKPFGRDLASAQVLNQQIHQYFHESQVYRIDHYLGKETVQNLLVFRFANAIFESLWNRNHIDAVQITVAEEIGVGARAGYYDQAGALRDMVQNHLTQLLTLIAMEPPVTSDADDIRNEKAKVLHAVRPLKPDDVIFGQYEGYLQEPGVRPDSRTETFVALRLWIDNWRWQGVPFYLRTGKRLPRKITQIAIRFRQPPVCLFPKLREGCVLHANILYLNLQPDEGFELCVDVKAPGEPFDLKTESFHFRYAEAFGPLPDAYETLLLDILAGDATLFVRADEVEAAWHLYDPILKHPPPVHLYKPGTWGPPEAERLVAQDRETWLTK